MRFIWKVTVLQFFIITVLFVNANAQSEFQQMDTETLANLAKQGEIVIIKDVPGKNIYVTSGIIINAPADKIMSVITNWEKLAEYMPQVEKTKVKKISDTEYLVDFYLAIKFSVLKIKVDYQLRQTIESPLRVSWVQTRGEMKNVAGSWDLVPINDKQTIAFYSTSGDLKSMGRLARWMLAEHPEMEMALHVSTAVLAAKATKKRVEALYKSK